MRNSRCHHFENSYCRSCTLLSLTVEEEVAKKTAVVTESIAPLLKSNPKIFPLWRPHTILPSRSKAKLQVSGTSASPVVGLLTFDGRNTEAKELLDCPLHLPAINDLLSYLAREFIPHAKLEPYDPKSRFGELKGIIVMANEDATRLILRFIARSSILEKPLRAAIPLLQRKFPSVEVVSLNIQPIPHAILEGPDETVLTERHSIEENFSGFSVKLSPQSFKQVTHATADALYSRARERVSGESIRSVVDLYCGAGAFTFALAPVVETGLGVEISEETVNAANRRAEKFPGIRFEAADLEVDFERYLSTAPDLLVVNPPRRGLSGALIQAANTHAPKNILYSSCNPKTLLRDLLTFEEQYLVTELHPFDMFPQTDHLEVLALLKRKA